MQADIEALFDQKPERYTEEHFRLFDQFKQALNRGQVRAAEPDASAASGWRVNAGVKKGVLLGFRMGTLEDMSIDAHRQPFYDKCTYPVKRIALEDAVRIVPGGSSIRDGCYVGRGVTCMPPMYINAGSYVGEGVICMPPMYINVGAYVGEGTLVDSHALVGSCAQIGRRVHLSASAQIGGVLEPVGALPVLVEDEVLVGGNCGVYEGAVIKSRAVLASGTVITHSTPIYDLPNERIIHAGPGEPLIVPAGAVVVPGTRPIAMGAGKRWGLSVATPVIVKYRDERTSAKAALEEWLR